MRELSIDFGNFHQALRDIIYNFGIAAGIVMALGMAEQVPETGGILSHQILHVDFTLAYSRKGNL